VTLPGACRFSECALNRSHLEASCPRTARNSGWFRKRYSPSGQCLKWRQVRYAEKTASPACCSVSSALLRVVQLAGIWRREQLHGHQGYLQRKPNLFRAPSVALSSLNKAEPRVRSPLIPIPRQPRSKTAHVPARAVPPAVLHQFLMTCPRRVNTYLSAASSLHG